MRRSHILRRHTLICIATVQFRDKCLFPGGMNFPPHPSPRQPIAHHGAMVYGAGVRRYYCTISGYRAHLEWSAPSAQRTGDGAVVSSREVRFAAAINQ